MKPSNRRKSKVLNPAVEVFCQLKDRIWRPLQASSVFRAEGVFCLLQKREWLI
jgi:hypothetical protein